LLLAAMTAGSGVAGADPAPLPAEFLEYLGSWEADDGDWLVASAAPVARAKPDSRTDQPAPDAAQPASRSTTVPARGTTAAAVPGTEPTR
jgi:hypothetical protein